MKTCFCFIELELCVSELIFSVLVTMPISYSIGVMAGMLCHVLERCRAKRMNLHITDLSHSPGVSVWVEEEEVLMD